METRALPGAGAGMGNTITTPSSGSGPVKAGTQPISYSGPGTPLSPDWNGQAAIDGAYFQSVWVQRPLSAIAETIAGLPFVAGMDPENPAATNPQAVLARLLGPASPRAPGGPNPRQSAASFWKWNITQKLATGKMAWELQLDPTAMRPDGKGKAIVGLWSLVSFLLDPIPTGGGSTEYFSGYKYNLSHDPLYMKPERVFYAWRPSQRDPRQPESFLQAAALPISISVAIERYMWALLKNGMVATHVVTAAPLEEPENRRAWEEQFISSFTGFDQAGKPIFAYADVENGKVTDAFSVTPIAQTSQQAELLAFAGWVKNEILVATGVPESLIGNASQRIYSNADSEYRTFWTNTVINIVAELQDDVNTQLAPLLGPEVGWFDLSRVVALQPPTPFAQPQLTDLMAAGIMSVPQAQSALGVEDSGYIDTSDAPIGEESSTVGPGTSSKASAPMPELRGWSWEYRGMNTHTLKSGTWRRLIHQRERIVVPPSPQPTEVIDVASTPIDTRGYQAAERILATVTALREKRTAHTAEASSTHVPVGPGELWHDPTIHLPDYVEHLANALRAAGHSESEAVAMAVGIIRGWAAGRASHGHVHPDVQAAAAKAIAEWDALKASHNKSKRNDDAWTELARIAKEVGAEVFFDRDGKRAVAEFAPGGPGSTFTGVGNPDSSGAGLLLPVDDPKRPKPREAELVGPHRYIPNVRDVKHCSKCGKGPLAAVHKDWAKVKQAAPVKRDSVATVEALLGRPVESRHRGPDHVHVPTGHANTPARKRQALKAAHREALAGYEDQFAGPMRALFAKQQTTTLSRLNGRRGRVMVRRATEAILEARATSQPGPAPNPPSDGVPVTTAAPTGPAAPTFVDAAAIFDTGFWTAETAKHLLPAYDKVATASTQRVRDQLGPAAGVTDEIHSMSNASIQAALRARAATISTSIARTTYDSIARTLGDGIAAGEGIPQLADRVKGVFTEASDSRATLISRTESHSASAMAADGYTQALPQGIVAGSEWLSVHDDRTREDHRKADGQRQFLGVPFRVGNEPLMYPGDPKGSPAQTIACRCARAFIPQSQAHLLTQAQPKDFTYNPQAPTAA